MYIKCLANLSIVEVSVCMSFLYLLFQFQLVLKIFDKSLPLSILTRYTHSLHKINNINQNKKGKLHTIQFNYNQFFLTFLSCMSLSSLRILSFSLIISLSLCLRLACKRSTCAKSALNVLWRHNKADISALRRGGGRENEGEKKNAQHTQMYIKLFIHAHT